MTKANHACDFKAGTDATHPQQEFCTLCGQSKPSDYELEIRAAQDRHIDQFFAPITRPRTLPNVWQRWTYNEDTGEYLFDGEVAMPNDVLNALNTDKEETIDRKPSDIRCTYDLGDRPDWMSPGQYDPCRCTLYAGHTGPHLCEHTRI